jgi:hypothetical protein
LRRKLEDAEGDIRDDIIKPKWMRWGTFDRKVEELFAIEQASEDAWAGFIGKFLQRYGSGAKKR